MAGQVTMPGGNRFYLWPSADRKRNERYWSVTTIIGALDKPALKQWAANQAADYALEHLSEFQASLNSALTEVGEGVPIEALIDLTLRTEGRFVDPLKLDALQVLYRDYVIDHDAFDKAYGEVRNRIANAHKRTTNAAAVRGTDVHNAIEAHNLQKPYPGVPRAAAPRYRQFLRFLEEHPPGETLASEASVFNRTRRYAGRFDWIATFPDFAPYFQRGVPIEKRDFAVDPPVCIVDVKNSARAYPEAALQMNAYANAEFIGGPEGSELPMPAIDGAFVLRLAEDDYEVVPCELSDRVWKSFQYVYEAFRWQQETSKEVLGNALPPPAERVDPMSLTFGQAQQSLEVAAPTDERQDAE